MNQSSTAKTREQESLPAEDFDLREELAALLIGQPEAVERIVPYVELFQAGLTPPSRPAGVFLLLGPTGTGKTRTVEALAELLHGSERHVLKINCGEFQMEHEVAKLIGAPPGYLGHRETHPMLSQQKLAAVTSPHSDLSLVLFDEIEKAAPSFHRLLLGVLDKGQLRLGDNTSVCFDNTLIFMTSNVGAREMLASLQPGFGYASALPVEADHKRLGKIGGAALRRNFSPEFLNRVDVIITYNPLGTGALEQILDQELSAMQDLVRTRLGAAAFGIEIPEESRRLLIQNGTSTEYGARELKRTILRNIMQPIGSLAATGKIRPASCVRVEPGEATDMFTLNILPTTDQPCRRPRVERAGPRRRGNTQGVQGMAS